MALYFWLAYILQWMISVPLFVLEVYALVDAVSRPGKMYEAYGKKTKMFWLALLAVAAVIGLVAIPIIQSGINIFLTVVAVLPAGVYLADVRPALRGRSW
nr:DUF2516 family protein [Actinomycetales bacterium]